MHERAQVQRRLRQELPVPFHYPGGVFQLPEDRAPIDHADGVGLVEEASHDAEIAAAAAQSPEEVLVLRRTGGHQPPVGQYDIRLEQVVNRQTDTCARDSRGRRRA